MRKTVCLIFLLSLSLPSLFSQGLWTKPNSTGRNIVLVAKEVEKGKFNLSKLNLARAKDVLKSAPLQSVKAKVGVAFPLPLPDETFLLTTLVESPIWEEKYSTQFANLKTYMLLDPANGSLQGRVTLTPEGVSGLLFTDKGTVYIHPVKTAEQGTHVSFYTKHTKVKLPECGSKGNAAPIEKAMRTAAEDDNKKRVYRLAVATTAEYTSWAGGQANALTHLTISINNVNAIYNRDLNVTLNIVSPPSIRFTNAATDPYPGGNVFLDGAATNANQTTLNNIIGAANYDLGIVFNNGWNRGYVPVPSFGSVCNNAIKGQGAAGVNHGTGANPTTGPQGLSFDFTVAHEIGHQFGCHHSYASNVGTCTGFANPPTAFEPGSGSTIMGYGGYANCNTYVNYGESYFHAGSIAEAKAYMNSGGNCVTATTTANTSPVVILSAASYNVPISTPFTLTGKGSDADGDALLYNWEEMDAGVLTTTPPAASNTAGPNFRSYAPVPNGNIRTFPRMADIAAGVSPPYEVLPSVTRTMHFRLTARDGSALGGATSPADVVLNFNSSAGPFIVTSQPSATTWAAGSLQTVAWNVANTAAAPVNCSAVNILFSVDGGLTYPYVLAGNTPNDGNQQITAPNIQTVAGRLKVEAVNNVFFNINTATISVTSGCAANGAMVAQADSVSAPVGSPALNLSLTPQYGNSFTPTGTITASNPSTFLTIYNSSNAVCASYGFTGSFRYATHSFEVATPGTYTFTPAKFGLVYNLYSESFSPDFPCTNFIASNTVTGSSGTTIGPNVSASLIPGRRYVLVAGTFSATFPALPFTYTVNVTGGNIYSNPPNPGGAFSYYYVIVNNTDGLVKAVAPTINLSNAATYPAGTGYTVYGLSYSNASPAVSAFVGGSFAALQNTLLFNASYCGSLSRNAKRVMVLAQYTFIGNGAWSNAANWSNNLKPPSPTPPKAEIIIDPAGNGECVLDVQQVVSAGSKLTVISGKKFRVEGKLTLE